MEFEIHREGQPRVELIVQGYDSDDALNTFADYLERRDVPAFWHRDGAGASYVLASGERYYARGRGETLTA